MSKEIQFLDATGQTDYVNLTNSAGQWYNTVGGVFETFNASNFADYDIAATEFGTSGQYAADMPAVAAGVYYVVARRRAGGSPAQSDQFVADGEIQWGGTAVASLSAVQLADGVLHGGSTARLRLGATGSNPAVQIESVNGTGILVTSTGTGDAVQLDSVGGSGLVVLGDSAAAAVRFVHTNDQPALQVTSLNSDDAMLVGTDSANPQNLNAVFAGNLTQKVLGGGSSTITGVGARVVDASGNNVAPAATALSTATWTNARAAKLDNADVATSSRAAPGDQMALTAGTITSIASAVWAFVTEGAFTAVQIMRGVASFVMGKATGGGSSAPAFRDLGDTKDRISMTVDSAGSRTNVSRDLS